jgi:hypothetical protein
MPFELKLQIVESWLKSIFHFLLVLLLKPVATPFTPLSPDNVIETDYDSNLVKLLSLWFNHCHWPMRSVVHDIGSSILAHHLDLCLHLFGEI